MFGISVPSGGGGAGGGANGADGKNVYSLADENAPAPGFGADTETAITPLGKRYVKSGGTWSLAGSIAPDPTVVANSIAAQTAFQTDVAALVPAPSVAAALAGDTVFVSEVADLVPPGEPGAAGGQGPEGPPAEPAGGADLFAIDDGKPKVWRRAIGDPFGYLEDAEYPTVDRLVDDLRPLATPITGARWTPMPAATGVAANTFVLEDDTGGTTGIASPVGVSTMLARKRTPLRETAAAITALPVGRHRYAGNLQRLSFATAPAAAAINDTITATGGKSGVIIAIDGNDWTVYRTVAFANGDGITGPVGNAYTSTITALSSFSSVFARLNPARAETPDVDMRNYDDGFFSFIANTSLPLRTGWITFFDLRQPTFRAFTPQTPTGAIIGWDPSNDYSGLPRTSTTAQTAISQGARFPLKVPSNFEYDGPLFMDVICRSSVVTFAARTIDAEAHLPTTAGGAIGSGTDLVLTAAIALAADTVFATHRFSLASTLTEAVCGTELIGGITAAISNVAGTAGTQDGYMEIAAIGLTCMRRG